MPTQTFHVVLIVDLVELPNNLKAGRVPSLRHASNCLNPVVLHAGALLPTQHEPSVTSLGHTLNVFGDTAPRAAATKLVWHPVSVSRNRPRDDEADADSKSPDRIAVQPSGRLGYPSLVVSGGGVIRAPISIFESVRPKASQTEQGMKTGAQTVSMQITTERPPLKKSLHGFFNTSSILLLSAFQ